LQKRTSEGWRTITRSLCVNATDTSTFTRTFDNRRHDGVEWRVRMTSGSTETHAELKSRWTYITFKALPTARQAN
jgi:hypothetical protein